MAKIREHLNMDDDIDISDLTSTPQEPPSTEEYKRMQEAGEKLGFYDRSPKIKKQKKRSPYVIQHNSKMRFGMKELLSDLTANIGAKSDQETLELSLIALIEKKGLEKLEKRFKDLIESNNYI